MIIVLSVLLIMTAIFVIYYWADFYIRGGVQVIKEDWYIRFQRAFPPADLWMTACAFIGAIGLLTEQTYGVLLYIARSKFPYIPGPHGYNLQYTKQPLSPCCYLKPNEG